MNTDTDAVTRMLKRAIDLLDTALGDSDPMIDDDMPQEEIEAAYPVMCAMQILTNLLTIQCTPTLPAQSCGDAEQADEADFKNFHRLLCDRFGYVHDEADWKRDQLSLVEHIAAKQALDAGRYRRFKRWHPRLQTSYWTGQWWEPIYGEKMDACVDSLDEVPQPTPHAVQSAARAKDSK